MEQTGYLVRARHSLTQRSVAAVLRSFVQITENEEQALIDYLAFPRSYAKRERRKK